MNELKDLAPKKDVKGGSPISSQHYDEQTGPKHIMINTNTYVSVGLIMLIVGGIWAILSAISSIKSDIQSARVESNARFDKVENRVSNIETSKNVWTATDMYKWAIHLQQQNRDPKALQSEGLKVPEPEINTK